MSLNTPTTTPAPEQLVLDLALRPALGAEDFMVSRANAAAVDLVDRWPDWPLASAMVVGPARSGKSHLANVWRRRSGAGRPIPAASIDEGAIGLLEQFGALVIEDIDQGIADDRAMFHLLNVAREHRRHLLLTSARAPGDLDVALPDLRSRLRALPLVHIEAPDVDLLRGVLVKLFNDRQLIVEPHVIGHLVLHMERSMAMATRLVDEIDRRALAGKRRVSRTLAAEVLSATAEGEPAGSTAEVD